MQYCREEEIILPNANGGVGKKARGNNFKEERERESEDMRVEVGEDSIDGSSSQTHLVCVDVRVMTHFLRIRAPMNLYLLYFYMKL